MYLPFECGVGGGWALCLVLHYYVCLLDQEERVVCFTLLVFFVSWCFGTLLHGAVGLSAVCDCGIS